MRTLVALLVLVAGALGNSLPLRAAEPAAMITEVKGGATVRGAAVRTAQWLMAGDVLSLAADGEATAAVLRAGAVFALRGPGRFVADEQGVRALDARGQLVRRDLIANWRQASLRAESAAQASVVMRSGEAAGLAVLAPRGAQLSADARRLAWRDEEGRGSETQYRLRLIGAHGEVLFESEPTAGELTLPPDVSLVGGERYVIELIATTLGAGSVRTAAEFSVIDASLERQLLALRPDARASRTEQILYEALLRQHGLLQAAERVARTPRLALH